MLGWFSGFLCLVERWFFGVLGCCLFGFLGCLGFAEVFVLSGGFVCFYCIMVFGSILNCKPLIYYQIFTFVI